MSGRARRPDMPIQRLSTRHVTVLKNPGKRSKQLVWPRNAPEASMTITRVTIEPGAVSRRHAHAKSEQIWIVERGFGVLLMAGDIVRTPPGETHGVRNTGSEPLVYLAITSPPEDFTSAYENEEAEERT